MIGPYIVAGAVFVLVIGFFVVAWDWTVRSDPDAPHGGPIVIAAVVALLCGGMVTCSETTKTVMEMKKAALSGEGQP